MPNLASVILQYWCTELIIDPSEDVFELIESFKLDDLLDGVTDVLITHSHPDHFSVSAIEKLAERKLIRVYASASVKQDVIGLKNVEYREIYSFALQKIGDFSVLPLPSNHFADSKDEVALNFLIERDGKTLFYGLDGAFINPLAFEILKEVKTISYLNVVSGAGNRGNESAYKDYILRRLNGEK